MERMTIHGLDGVTGAHASPVRGSTGLYFIDVNGTGKVLGEEARHIVALDFSGQLEGELEGLAVALHGNGHCLIGVESGAGLHGVPVGIVGVLKSANDVAGLKAGFGRCRVGEHPLHRCGLYFNGGNLVEDSKVKEHQHESQNEVGNRAGNPNQHPLPAGMRCERTGVVCHVLGGAAGRLEVLLWGFAGHLDEAAKGEKADFVVRIAILESKEARTEAEGERLNAHSAELGNGEVAKLVDYNHQADQDDKRSYSNEKFMHKCTIIPSTDRSVPVPISTAYEPFDAPRGRWRAPPLWWWDAPLALKRAPFQLYAGFP